MDLDGEGGIPFCKQPPKPPPGRRQRFAQNVLGPFVAGSKFGTDQHSPGEFELFQAPLDDAEIFVIQFLFQRGKKGPEAFRFECRGLSACHFFQSFQDLGENLERFHGLPKNP